MVTIILSAYRAERSPEQNAIAHDEALMLLRPLKPVSAVGAYRGTLEQSIMVSVPDSKIPTWSALGRTLGQESILVKREDGSCFLVSCEDNSETYLGVWTEVSREVAEGREAYTRIGDSFYVAV